MEFVKEYKDALGHNFCERIIHMFENDNNKIKIDNPHKITSELHSDNWNSESWNIIYAVLKDTLDKHVIDYYNSLGDLFKFFISNEDSGFQIERYAKDTGIYNFHHDFSLDIRGFRSISYIFYLNDVFEGGEIEFYNGTKIKPERGKLIFFPSSWNYVYKSNIPLSNNKYVLTGFVYSKL